MLESPLGLEVIFGLERGLDLVAAIDLDAGFVLVVELGLEEVLTLGRIALTTGFGLEVDSALDAELETGDEAATLEDGFLTLEERFLRASMATTTKEFDELTKLEASLDEESGW